MIRLTNEYALQAVAYVAGAWAGVIGVGALSNATPVADIMIRLYQTLPGLFLIAVTGLAIYSAAATLQIADDPGAREVLFDKACFAAGLIGALGLTYTLDGIATALQVLAGDAAKPAIDTVLVALQPAFYTSEIGIPASFVLAGWASNANKQVEMNDQMAKEIDQ